MRSSTVLLAVASFALERTLAGPTHAHFHRNAHHEKNLAKKDDTYDLSNVDWQTIDWKAVGVNWDDVNYSNDESSSTDSTTSTSTSTVAQSTPASSAAPFSANQAASISAAASPSAPAQVLSSVAGQVTDLFENLWNDLQGCSNDRASFGDRSASSGDEVSYIPNVGIPYGSNMMIVDSVGNYEYTMTFTNSASAPMTINVWEKAGKDGQPNSGATDAPKFTTLTFNLSPGQSATVAFDENSVVAACEAVDHIDASGAFAQTWVEAKFKQNDSGFDVSAILNNGPVYKVTMSAKETPCVSSETENMWLTASDSVGSGSCYIPGAGAHLTVNMQGN